ncbi:Hsp20/alpha crystallin family protein [Neobacillus ginsengisoli]|uniref:Spore coat protein M/HSP20 family protein n=1 Tax=Neobacillus ginsengisoli TaxID=904295 RepID=A0ABT9XX16_9BACI|nr:Hsp20/alpha crystallin family protein [Neobacillus ginsengisoli]MDQ0200036.1 spore coat protein M/HSP20 family protein [Neobacillus ginsengisoli]
MKPKKDEQFVDYDQVEIWLKNYFLDPLTSYFDQTQFRIDLYETEKEWIVEAILSEYESSEISVYTEEKRLIISALKHSVSKKQKRIRVIDFPFQINKKKVTAVFTNGILEVQISKTEAVSGKNRYIILP